MSKLEELTVGSHVNGLISDEPVQIIAVNWYGSSVLDVTYKDSHGALGNQLIYREDEARLQVLEDKLPWSFDADGDTMRLVSEAYRINLAHLFDPYLAVHTSAVEPLPHQISAVYHHLFFQPADTLSHLIPHAELFAELHIATQQLIILCLQLFNGLLKLPDLFFRFHTFYL